MSGVIKITAAQIAPMDATTRAELEERVRIGKAAEMALAMEDSRQSAEDPRVGRDFFIKVICREVLPNQVVRVEAAGDIYEFPEGALIPIAAEPVGYGKPINTGALEYYVEQIRNLVPGKHRTAADSLWQAFYTALKGIRQMLEQPDAEPVGYANFYQGMNEDYSTTIYVKKEDATRAANPHAKEVAVPLYRHPAPQPEVPVDSYDDNGNYTGSQPDAEPVDYACLYAELQNIASGTAMPDEFKDWAQSRARYALENAAVPTPARPARPAFNPD